MPNQDIVLGLYFLNKEKLNKPEIKKVFYSPEEALIAYDHNAIDLHESIVVKMKSKKVETTPGRIIFNRILPPQMEFVNDKMDKKQIGKLVGLIFERYGSTNGSSICGARNIPADLARARLNC